jgi:hypothetical protein
MKRLSAYLLGALVLASCASRPGSDNDAVAGAAPKPVFERSEAPDPAPLAGIGIPSGSCGLVLWARSGSRVAPIFRSIGATDAVMKIEGAEVPLSLVQQSGELRLGLRAQQTYRSAEGAAAVVTVQNRLTWGQPFPGGIYVERGAITVEGEDGWSRVLPVAGIAGCKR